MEKVILKSNSQEISLNPKDNELFESFVYEPTELPDKKLGSLYILGHVEKKSGEDINYILNLIYSLMKREHYSDPNSDAKLSFEKGLKKLNEILKDFFRDKESNLNLGILAIAGDSILISKLGKFKILLLRDGDFIDIFNNVGLFSKDKIQEQQFSNVVSGKLTGKDSIFAYYPGRSLTRREKKIKDLLKNSTKPDDFMKGINALQTKSAFPCQGLFISMEKIKEVASIPKPIISSVSSSEKKSGVQNMLKDLPDLKKEEAEGQNPPEENLDDQGQKINPSELSLAKRENGIDKLFHKTKKIGSMKPKHRFVVSALVLTLVMGVFLGFRSFDRTSSGFKAARDIAETALQESKQKISSNDIRGARSSLANALLSLEEFNDNKKAQELISEVENELYGLNKTSSRTPTLLADLAEEGVKASHVIKTANSLYIFNKADGKFTSLDNLDEELVYVFADPNIINFADGERFYSKTLNDETGITAADFYADNLYLVSDSIYKYTDIALKGAKRSLWLEEPLDADIVSIAVDGKVYALTSDGKVVVYFTGEKLEEFNLQINPSSDSEIFTRKDLNKLIVFNPGSKQIMSFNKSNGNLIETFELSNIENPRSVSVGDSGDIYILSGDNKIWEL